MAKVERVARIDGLPGDRRQPRGSIRGWFIKTKTMAQITKLIKQMKNVTTDTHTHVLVEDA
jgi:hypothetical protein